MEAPIYQVIADGKTTETKSSEVASRVFVKAKKATLRVNYGKGFQVIGSK